MITLLKRVLLNPSYYFYKIIYINYGILVRAFCPIKINTVLCWSDAGRSFGCNPKAIYDYLFNYCQEYTLAWAFLDPTKYLLNYKTLKYKFPSLKFVYAINTSEYLITNQRTFPKDLYWKKRGGQKYIMTWHGSMGIKRSEADMNRTPLEIKLSHIDSKNCDVMLSDSKWFNKVIRRQLEFTGTILEIGIPRNDIYFDASRVNLAIEKVRRSFSVSSEVKIVLYAPTFRKGYSIDAYLKDWSKVKHSLEIALKGKVVVFIRFHQVLKSRYNVNDFCTDDFVFNATEYDDMQELLCAADLLITDYSSTMFDMGLINKPCILYATDSESYDRGFLFKLSELPMPIAHNVEEFCIILENFNKIEYETKIKAFYKNTFDVFVRNHACKSFVEWMRKVSINK